MTSTTQKRVRKPESHDRLVGRGLATLAAPAPPTWVASGSVRGSVVVMVFFLNQGRRVLN
jgi:hypothetical protein